MFIRCLKSAVKLSILTATIFFLSLTSAQACNRASIPASAANPVPTARLDQSLFNRAVLSEVNFVRCKAGLQPLTLAGGLIKVAGNHANWMAERSTLSHKSTIRGQSSVQERVLASGVAARRGSENIGNIPRFQFSGARKIFVKNINQCDFATPSGRKIKPHSYSSLAVQIVDMWMGSNGHRKNVLDSNARSIGSAVKFDPRATHCGQFFLSQNFAG